jgi:hypothetical protein
MFVGAAGVWVVVIFSFFFLVTTSQGVKKKPQQLGRKRGL